MKIKFPIEIELDIEFDAHKGEPMRWHYPGHPPEIEITDLKFNGQLLPDDMAEEILKDHEDEIIQACWDEVKETEIDRAISRMEDR